MNEKLQEAVEFYKQAEDKIKEALAQAVTDISDSERQQHLGRLIAYEAAARDQAKQITDFIQHISRVTKK